MTVHDTQRLSKLHDLCNCLLEACDYLEDARAELRRVIGGVREEVHMLEDMLDELEHPNKNGDAPTHPRSIPNSPTVS